LKGLALLNCCNGLYVKPLSALTHFTPEDATTIFFFVAGAGGRTVHLQDRPEEKLEKTSIHQLLT
jgi:hypothetical protein